MTGSQDIRKDVRDAYDRIAPFFAETREKVWPPTMELIRERSPCILGDLGCGSGRALIEAARQGCRVVGIDSSEGQLKAAGRVLETGGFKNGPTLLQGDLSSLPLEDRVLDACLMIAVLHHLPQREERVRALEEAFRITRPGGVLQVSVWTHDQDRFRERHLSRIEGRRDQDELDGPLPGDHFVPWKRGSSAMRFYHLYGHGELEHEISMSPWTLQRSFFDGRNHWAECIRSS
ncbi:MAG: methyltransferase domain-containing protein [Candidatus Thermoplasmatota archaeon]|nr:methyltransferase domain-containing protein [Candidatus Thermoplasmatota archaeon]